jgi:predicted component of type VI protein secretion system
MKKIAIIISAFVFTLTLVGCTPKTPAASNQTNIDISQSSDTTVNATSSASASTLPTFAPTTDQDVKSLDSMVDKVNMNDYSDKSLEELK